MQNGKLYLGYEATAGAITATSGPNTYAALGTGAKDEIKTDAKKLLFDPTHSTPGLFSKAQPSGSSPTLHCETWDSRTDIPDAVVERDDWILARLQEAKINSGETYLVSATETAVRYIQHGNERICEHYYAITKQSDGQALKITVPYSDATPNPDHIGDIVVTVFAVIHI